MSDDEGKSAKRRGLRRESTTHDWNDIRAGLMDGCEGGQVEDFSTDGNEHVVGRVVVGTSRELVGRVDVFLGALSEGMKRQRAANGRVLKPTHNQVAENDDDKDGATADEPDDHAVE